jgi:hypothetical protein
MQDGSCGNYAMRPAVQERVREFVDVLKSSPHARYVLAVVVAGSAGRSEDRWHEGRLISDIDLMLVTPRTNPVRTRRLGRVMAPFRSLGIDGGPTPLPSLQRFRTLAFYEARATGKVVWGSYGLDELIPAIGPADIPRWEAVRVLANRAFEHIKLACGQTTPEVATHKSYEALSEAALVLEARYRPTYRERLSELIVERPSLLDLRSYEAAVEVHKMRLGMSGSRPRRTPGEAADALLRGLHDALTNYLGVSGSVAELLRELGERERHWKHRVYWGVTRPGQARSAVQLDPIIRLWQEAAALLRTGSSQRQAESLLTAWRACPQILRNQDASYAFASGRSFEGAARSHSAVSTGSVARAAPEETLG